MELEAMIKIAISIPHQLQQFQWRLHWVITK